MLRSLPAAESRHQPLMAIACTVPALTQRFEGRRFAPGCSVALASCSHTLP
ncbi:MAG: hypothetical protein ING89_11290 [Rubrivivax sp.]|nr:hypothetical protein [Rubrivivax sp.]